MSTSLQVIAETAEQTPAIPVCVNQHRLSRGPNRGTRCRFSDRSCICIGPGQTAVGADFSSCEYVCYKEKEIEPTLYRLWDDTTHMSVIARRTWQEAYPPVSSTDKFMLGN